MEAIDNQDHRPRSPQSQPRNQLVEGTDAGEPATELEKSFKPSWVFAMALGSAIGWGAFILPFDWISSAGLAGTFLGFAVGGILITIVGLNYGVVVRHLPVTGGGVAYALASLGRLHAFISGWCLTLGYIGTTALNASAVTLVFRISVPNLVERVRLYSVAGWDIYLPEILIASAFIVVFGWYNHRGASLSGRFQFVAVSLIIASVSIIAISMLVYYFTHDVALAPAIPEGVSLGHAVIVIIAISPWAFVGFDTIPQLAGEFDFSPRKARGLLLWGIFSATAIYLAMMLSTSIAVGTESARFSGSAWPPAVAIEEVLGPIGLILMLVGVSAGVLTGLNGFMTATSRVLYTMGRAQMLPKSFAQLHPKNATPTTAIIFTCVAALITPWFGRQALTWVVDMTSVGIAVAYFYACFTTLRLSRGHDLPGVEEDLGSKRSLTVLGAAGCLVALGFLAILLIPGSPGSLGRESMIALAAWAVLGIGTWLYCRRSFLAAPIEEVHSTVLDANE